MSDDACKDPKNVKMKCLPCVMPYTDDLENLVQAGAKQEKQNKTPQNKKCHGNVDDHNSTCQCTPEHPCCNFPNVDTEQVTNKFRRYLPIKTEELHAPRKKTKKRKDNPEARHTAMNIMENQPTYPDTRPAFCLELLKGSTVSKTHGDTIIYVQSCESHNSPHPCYGNLNFYKTPFSTPFLCLERIKNPTSINNEK